MVVVDNARRMISKNIDIVVTSVLQTTAGKMIFGRYIEAPGAAAPRSRRRRRRPSAQAPVGAPKMHQCQMKPWHWWRTVFYLIPAVSVYTIVLGHGVAGLHAVRSPRQLRPQVRARVVVADPEDERRARRGRGARAARSRRAATFSRPITRASTTFPILFASLPFQLRIISKDSIGRIPFMGWHLQPHRPRAGRSVEVRRRHREEDGAAGRGRALADRVSGRHAQHRRLRGARSRGLVPRSRCRRSCRSCRSASWAAVT